MDWSKATDRQIVLVCDDDLDRIRNWRQKIESFLDVDQFEVREVTGTELAELADALFARGELPNEDGAKRTTGADAASLVDSAILMVLDCNLTPDNSTVDKLNKRNEVGHKFRQSMTARTGESLAYYAKAFSDCGMIVVVNHENSTATFDVTLQQFANSYADLNVSADDLLNSALWVPRVQPPPAEMEYLPWQWPSLAEAPGVRESINAILPGLDAHVLEAFELDYNELSTRQLDVFGYVDSVQSATMRDLAFSDMGFKSKDFNYTDDEIARMSRSVLFRWLEHTILAAQNVISDVPASVLPAC